MVLVNGDFSFENGRLSVSRKKRDLRRKSPQVLMLQRIETINRNDRPSWGTRI
jgi:hypothetical protein